MNGQDRGALSCSNQHSIVACDVGSISGTTVHLQVCYCYIFEEAREGGREMEEEEYKRWKKRSSEEEK